MDEERFIKAKAMEMFEINICDAVGYDSSKFKFEEEKERWWKDTWVTLYGLEPTEFIIHHAKSWENMLAFLQGWLLGITSIKKHLNIEDNNA